MTISEMELRYAELFASEDGYTDGSPSNCAVKLFNEATDSGTKPLCLAIAISCAAERIGFERGFKASQRIHSPGPIAVPAVSPTTPPADGNSPNPITQVPGGDPISNETSENQ